MSGSDYKIIADRIDKNGSYDLYVTELDGSEIAVLVDRVLSVEPEATKDESTSLASAFFSFAGLDGDSLGQGSEDSFIAEVEEIRERIVIPKTKFDFKWMLPV